VANPKRRDAKLDQLTAARTLTAGQLDRTYAKLVRAFHRFEKLTKRMKRLDRGVTERLVELSKDSRKADGKKPATAVAGIPGMNQDRVEPDSSGSAGIDSNHHHSP